MTEADKIIEQCKAIASQQFPELHQPGRLAYYAQYSILLETKIRELLYRAPALQVRDTMPANLIPSNPGELDGGWIEWKGGECPVRYRTVVAIKFRAGVSIDETPADGWVWEHDGEGGDIVAYKVLP